MRRIEIVLLYFSHVRSSKHPFLIYLIHLFAPFYYYYYYFSLCTRKKLIKLDRKVEFIWKNNKKNSIKCNVFWINNNAISWMCIRQTEWWIWRFLFVLSGKWHKTSSKYVSQFVVFCPNSFVVKFFRIFSKVGLNKTKPT